MQKNENKQKIIPKNIKNMKQQENLKEHKQQIITLTEKDIQHHPTSKNTNKIQPIVEKNHQTTNIVTHGVKRDNFKLKPMKKINP
jgi:hypothetical protein